MNDCLLSKGTDQVATTYLAAKITGEAVAFDSLFQVWARILSCCKRQRANSVDTSSV